MRDEGLDVLVVRATDTYLNEYVPEDDSTRIWLTGFTGSTGDAVITSDRCFLIVDGRYELQAAQECPVYEVRVTALGTSIEMGWLGLLDEVAHGKRVGIEADRISASLFATLQKRGAAGGYTLVSTVPSIVEEVRTSLLQAPPRRAGQLWAIDPGLAGRTVHKRLAEGMVLLQQKQTDANAANLDGLLLTALDEIAWVTNLRGDQFPFQATFRSTAVAANSEVILAADAQAVRPGRSVEDGVRVVGEAGLLPALLEWQKGIGRALRLGIDPATAPAALVQRLTKAGIELTEVQSPFALLRTKKTKEELAHMVAAFRRADDVVSEVQKWLNGEVKKGHTVTEAMVAKKTEERFFSSGAFGLSFKVISAAGKNGAVIHYSTPDDKRPIKKGELFLLDTGAYYEGGYATDLTRTFLVGPATTKANKEQRRLFTLVLKAAIAGMSARIPIGATGEQLDALVRAPLWAHGLDYGHGTGHGVGVNVHESPPRITIGSRVPLEPGQVFSIEPGIYLPDWGGVRIENLCTVIEDPQTPPKGVNRRFLRVKPLTFSPLDMRLVDRRLLTDHEKRFVSWFRRGNSKILPPTS